MTAGETHQPMLGIGAKMASVSLFVIVSSLVKSLENDVPTGQIVFFRSIFAIPVIVLWLVLSGQFLRGIRTANAFSHVWRGLLGTCAMSLSFVALGLLPLAEVTVLGYLAPLLVVLLAGAFLGERLSAALVFAVLLGLAGVTVAALPRLGSGTALGLDSPQTLGVAAVVVAAVLMAVVQVLIRQMVRTETVSSIVFWYAVTSATASFFTIALGWIVPSPAQLATLIGAGLLGGLAQILMTNAYRYADASTVAPFDYWAIVMAILIGIVVFGDMPTLMMMAGAALIVSAGLIIIWQERNLGRLRARQKQGTSPHG